MNPPEIQWLELECGHVKLQEDGMTPFMTTCKNQCNELVHVKKAGYVTADGKHVYFLPGAIGVTEYYISK